MGPVPILIKGGLDESSPYGKIRRRQEERKNLPRQQKGVNGWEPLKVGTFFFFTAFI